MFVFGWGCRCGACGGLLYEIEGKYSNYAKVFGTPTPHSLIIQHSTGHKLLLKSENTLKSTKLLHDTTCRPYRKGECSYFPSHVQSYRIDNASLQAIDERRGTALQIAARCGHRETLQILLNYCAKVNADPVNLETALQMAASETPGNSSGSS